MRRSTAKGTSLPVRAFAFAFALAIALAGVATAQEPTPAESPAPPPPPSEALNTPPAPAAGAPEGAGGWHLRWGGYAKSLYVRSRTVDGTDEAYDLSLSRLRVKVDAELGPRVTLHVEEDLELRLGSYLETAEFHAAVVDPVAPEYLVDPGRRLAWGDEYELSQRPFRAYARASVGPVDVTAGRQRIPLGVGRIWSTLDLLNPVNPLAVEREEYVGVDAAKVDVRVGALSKLLLVYAPAPGSEEFRGVVRFQANVQASDLAITAGRFWSDTVVGVDFATQLGGAGLRGEATWVVPEIGRAHVKGVLGIDYAPTDKLTLSAEAYATGQSEADRNAAFADNVQLLRLMPAGGRDAGISAEYEITPLLRVTATALVNLEDGSACLLPAVAYSFADDWVAAGGGQLFLGSERSEYGRGKPLGYLQLQRFF